ncbi:prephenate dehydrogenase [Nonomuraea gerenzanensis]|uniref:prephenate dehydrogenase n=1 Tax=Nonomuraea gerenzanensis TaxID=93944 RepID=UPI001CD948A4|nr:prephenate dehydrogenase [Nonomuraea gerenzanensis]UBU18073.1 prephenate dehydrogenase [Nonomuraea gerenzanensis]
MRKVTVIGCGLIGTSVGLALRRAGVRVALADRDPRAVATAVSRGAGVPLPAGAASDGGVTQEAGVGVPWGSGPADVVVIATPPSAVVPMLRWAQARGLGVLYTDVASVKARLLAEAEAAGCDLGSFVPGHPMAGRESSGPGAASADLFEGRPWAVCHHPALSPHAVRAVTTLVSACGARVVAMGAEDHDRAAAAVSHAPHVVSSTLAARFAGAGEAALILAGRGLLDVTRVAGGPSGLWCDILEHNAEPVADVLEAVAGDLDSVVAALRSGDPARLAALTDVLGAGNAGRSRIVRSWPGASGAPRPPVRRRQDPAPQTYSV